MRIKRSKLICYCREMMFGVNHYSIELNGALECRDKSWALAKKGGTAEVFFRPFVC